MAKLLEQSKKNKKKTREQRQKIIKERKKQTPAISHNITNTLKKKLKNITSMKLSFSIVIKRIIILATTFCQKTSFNFDNLRISD